jgi:hypothetical protein
MFSGSLDTEAIVRWYLAFAVSTTGDADATPIGGATS